MKKNDYHSGLVFKWQNKILSDQVGGGNPASRPPMEIGTDRKNTYSAQWHQVPS